MIDITRIGPAQVPDLIALLRAIAPEESPGDPAAADRAEAGVAASRARYDFTQSDSFWVFVAKIDDKPVGCAAVCRIPKTDARAGYLFVDELHVLRAHRRRGIATRLLEHVEGLARELGLAGVRLLVRPGNAGARALYRRAGYVEGHSIFCEKGFES